MNKKGHVKTIEMFSYVRVNNHISEMYDILGNNILWIPQKGNGKPVVSKIRYKFCFSDIKL